MSAMEHSLRRALESGNAQDPAFRESIYAASERALERMLAQKGVGDERAREQRARLAETINRVEDDFYERQTEAGAAEDGPAQHDPHLSLDPAYMDAHAYATHPEPGDANHGVSESEEFELVPQFEGDPSDRAASEGPTAMTATAGGSAVSEPVKRSPRARKADAGNGATLRGNVPFRRFVSLALLVVLVLAAGAYILFAFAGSGRETAASQGSANWIELFDGARLEAIATPSGGRVEALDADATGVRPAVRFDPSGADSAITVAVGEGAAASLAGRRALVELAAGSPDGTPRSFAVECRFADAAACGRQVFNTTRRDETFVFDMNVPAAPAAGVLSLVPAASAGARADLDVYSVRMRDADAPVG